MSYFEENRAFFGLKGVLGRRDFIVNCLIIEVIEALLVVTPLLYASIFVPDFKMITLEQVRPLWYSVLQCVVALASTGLYFPSVVRRVRDIVGEEDDNRIFLIASTISVIIFMGYTPIAKSFFGGWILLFTLLSLIIMAGKITSEKPKSEVIKFNWGAFFGTWIWGLINKVPKTLWIIPMLLTSAWVPFMLICGFKGNEWAYEKNKEKFDNVDLFHLAQKTQTVILTILSPVIALLGVIVLTVVVVFAIHLSSKINPNTSNLLNTYSQQVQLKSAEDGFDRIVEDEKNPGVYMFYLDTEDWPMIVSSDFIRGSIVKSAINYTLVKNNKQPYSIESILENVELVNKVKVYSEFNNEVLIEVNMDPKVAKELLSQIDDKGKRKEIIKFITSSYRFNANPSIPNDD